MKSKIRAGPEILLVCSSGQVRCCASSCSCWPRTWPWPRATSPATPGVRTPAGSTSRPTTAASPSTMITWRATPGARTSAGFAWAHHRRRRTHLCQRRRGQLRRQQRRRGQPVRLCMERYRGLDQLRPGRRGARDHRPGHRRLQRLRLGREHRLDPLRQRQPRVQGEHVLAAYHAPGRQHRPD